LCRLPLAPPGPLPHAELPPRTVHSQRARPCPFPPPPAPRTVPSDKYQGRFAAEQLKKEGVNAALVVYSENTYGESLAFSFVAAFTKAGGEAVPLHLGEVNAGRAPALLDRLRRGGGKTGVFLAIKNVTSAAGAHRVWDYGQQSDQTRALHSFPCFRSHAPSMQASGQRSRRFRRAKRLACVPSLWATHALPDARAGLPRRRSRCRPSWPSFSARLAAIVKGIRTATPPINAPIFVSDSLMSPGFADAAGPANVVGIRGADVWGAPGFEVEFLVRTLGQ
jgi:hypothetical protein